MKVCDTFKTCHTIWWIYCGNHHKSIYLFHDHIKHHNSKSFWWEREILCKNFQNTIQFCWIQFLKHFVTLDKSNPPDGKIRYFLQILIFQKVKTKKCIFHYTWRSHGSDQLYINKFHGSDLFEIIPVPVIKPLSKQLYGRLCSVCLTDWHVQIINKHNLKQGRCTNQ